MLWVFEQITIQEHTWQCIFTASPTVFRKQFFHAQLTHIIFQMMCHFLLHPRLGRLPNPQARAIIDAKLSLGGNSPTVEPLRHGGNQDPTWDSSTSRYRYIRSSFWSKIFTGETHVPKHWKTQLAQAACDYLLPQERCGPVWPDMRVFHVFKVSPSFRLHLEFLNPS